MLGVADATAARAALDQTPPVVTGYRPGQMPSPVGDPVPSDAETLAARIAERAAGTSSPAAVLAILADLAGIRYLDAQQRAAALRVLATLPNITATGQHTGPSGRAGIGFQVNDDTTTVVLTVDPTSGRLLLHETVDTAGRRQTTLFRGGTGCGCPPAAGLIGADRFWPPAQRGLPFTLTNLQCTMENGMPILRSVAR